MTDQDERTDRTSAESEEPSPEATDEDALSALLDRVAERAAADGRDPDLVVAFARACYRRVPSARLRALDPDASATRLLDAYAFMDAREPGALALRVTNPDRDRDGWSIRGTVVDVNVDDSPFLLTTITEELGRLGHEVGDTLHPVLGVERDDDGRIAALHPARGAARREAWMTIELVDRVDADEIEDLADDLRRVLADARVATRDFPAMRAQIEEVAFRARASAGARYDADEVDEAIALLEWLLDDHFVFLGYREYDVTEDTVAVRRGSGLGILSDEDASAFATPTPLSEVRDELRARITGGDLLLVSRTNRKSSVHRQARMIYVGVKRVSGDGRIVGEQRFVGLFAQRAYAEPASMIPVLRRKLDKILADEDIVDHSFDERTMRSLFEAFPKHELFQADTQDLRRTLVDLLEIQKGRDVRLLCRVDPDRRSVSALVAVPRGRFNARIRKRIQALLVERFAATGVEYHLSISERDQALLHFVLHDDDGRIAEVNIEDLDREVLEITRTFADELRVELERAHGPEEGRRLADRWSERLPAGYPETTTPAAAVDDIVELDRLVRDDLLVRMTMRRDARDEDGLVRFRLYKVGPGVELSLFLPILESLGLVVVDERPFRVTTGLDLDIHIHDFGVRTADGTAVDVSRDGERLADAALAIWLGQAEADSLNRLVLRAGIGWDDVVVLRAYRRYRRQVGTSFTEAYQDDALVEWPDVARALVELFAARFDPEGEEGSEAQAPGPERGSDGAAAADAARDRVVAACDAIERLDQDRILRGFLGMIDATLRTNRYRRAPARCLALKMDSARVPDMPKPVPHVEVFVYAPEVEGVHLRGGAVARGGIRWSDRQEDFRTEVLGLMKAQMLKNAVIVPTGAKGGFVLKRPPGDPDALRDAVRLRYETFIRGLLDVTDNVVDGEVVPPEGVRRADGDDPYLVVAADRGTATFSDLANDIADEYGYWLGDAFASGGSHGYDHKAMGITARGAWVAVQRHFRELDIDVQSEPIRVVGIGDMSGDVFGNGLLRSDAVSLVAAFDHRDVFLDPEPDPAASFAERRRLFEVPRSSWQDYDRDRISEGGGVWSRQAKSVPLSPQVKRLLRVEDDELAPPELIRAILRAPADLLFAGGVGTFVKASGESHADVGDRANDAIRVDANELGARVVGEGGNLAVTQRGRIQYARRGGRINTDAIDNSAGVDTSDREVNLKILLNVAREHGLVADEDRDELLERMADDVAAQVLRDVYLQTWAISEELATSPGGMEAYETLMRDLVEAGRLDRAVEVLPGSDEVAQRAEAGAGFTRPEVAVLLGYAKTDLTGHLLAGGLPDQPALADVLARVFPPLARERFGDVLGEHRLRRELVATVVANDLVNRMGVTYANRTSHELGCRPAEVAAAYWVAREVAGADVHWRAVEALDGRVDTSLQLDLKAEVDHLVDAFTRSYVRQGASLPAAGDRAGIDIAAAVARDRPALDELEKVVEERLSPRRRRDRDARRARFVDVGVEPELAGRLAGLGELALVPDVAAVARTADQPVAHVAAVFLALSEALPLDRLHEAVQRLEPSGHWERWQHRGLVDDLRRLRRDAATRTLADHPDALPDDAVGAYLDARRDGLARVDAVIAQVDREQGAELPAIAVIVRALRDALASEED